ncbi:hypothetical protein MTR67_025589, partial [Solanum verrucosum]
LDHTEESAEDFIYTRDDGSIWNPNNPKYIQSGMLFMNTKQMKSVVRAYSLAIKKEFLCDQSKSKSWRVICKRHELGCNWMILFREISSDIWKAFKQSIDGLKSCRPIISIDGTHLYGLYDMKLLIAVGIDANGNIFPLAYALVARESFESWS